MHLGDFITSEALRGVCNRAGASRAPLNQGRKAGCSQHTSTPVGNRFWSKGKDQSYGASSIGKTAQNRLGLDASPICCVQKHSIIIIIIITTKQ